MIALRAEIGKRVCLTCSTRRRPRLWLPSSMPPPGRLPPYDRNQTGDRFGEQQEDGPLLGQVTWPATRPASAPRPPKLGFYDETPLDDVRRLEDERGRLGSELENRLPRWESLETELAAAG